MHIYINRIHLKKENKVKMLNYNRYESKLIRNFNIIYYNYYLIIFTNNSFINQSFSSSSSSSRISKHSYSPLISLSNEIIFFFSISSSNINSNLLFSTTLSGINNFLFYGHSSKKGGGNIGSTAILNKFSTIVGIILLKSGQESSKQGFVFASINHNLKLSSIIKSSPYNYIILINYFKTINSSMRIYFSICSFHHF